VTALAALMSVLPANLHGVSYLEAPVEAAIRRSTKSDTTDVLVEANLSEEMNQWSIQQSARKLV
jgi:hypothetical protein